MTVNPFDQLSEKDMAAFGKAFGDALGPHISAAIINATQIALKAAREELARIEPKVTLDLNRQG